MKPMQASQLAKVINAPAPDFDSTITGVTTDSRNIKPGDCFFAIKGPNFDGHDFAAKALEQGAACVVVENDSTLEKTLKVTNSIKALGLLAADYRGQLDSKLIAITGSVGKTTTRHITHHVLSNHYKVHQSPKNFNNDIGLPLTILGAEPHHEIIIAELGTNYPGEIEYLSKIAQPDIATVTNIRPAHLEGLGDMETIEKEKLSIAKGLKPNGIMIKDAHLKIKSKNIIHKNATSKFLIENTEIHLPLPGNGNIQNAITAWAICSHIGISLEDFAAAIKTLPPLPMRSQITILPAVTIIDDCYNANPASMENALETLAHLAAERNQRSVFICGEMAELGSHEEKYHRQLGRNIAENKVKLLIAVGPLAKLTSLAAKQAADYDIKTENFPDMFSACNRLEEFIKEHDIILVKGSRSAKLEVTIKKIKEIFAETAGK